MKICRRGLFPSWQICFPTLRMFTSAALAEPMTLRFGHLQQSKVFTIVSKDWDFHDQAVLRTGQPKVIWLRIGSCSTDRLAELLRSFSPAIEHFNADPASTLLMLP